MVQKRILFLLLFFSAIFACTHKSTPPASGFLKGAEVEIQPGLGSNYKICMTSDNYIPDTTQLELFPKKKIRVNFHFMNCEAGDCNFDRERGETFVSNLLSTMNRNLKDNRKMWLPEGNDTPVLPVGYRYVLTGNPDNPDDNGIYYHFDDELYFHDAYGSDKNNFQTEVIKKYGINIDEILNIFLMPDHKDVIANGEKSSDGTGIYIGKALKIGISIKDNGKPWEYRGLANHEVGHFLGLGHTWKQDDGCDDTPHNPNCYTKKKVPPCDKSEASNNMMDYNSLQNAVTPCQIGRIHKLFNKINSRQRKTLVKTWCKLKPGSHIRIREKTDWDCNRDLEGHLTIEPGASLTIKCRIAIPKNGLITVMPGAKLILDRCELHNDCGDKWQGIKVLGKGENRGKVVFIGKPKLENMQHPVVIPGSRQGETKMD